MNSTALFGTLCVCVSVSMFIYAYVWLCLYIYIYIYIHLCAELNGRAFKGVGLRPLACLDCGFEFLRGMDYRSLVLVECCTLSGRDLCVDLITRPEESYRLWCV